MIFPHGHRAVITLYRWFVFFELHFYEFKRIWLLMLCCKKIQLCSSAALIFNIQSNELLQKSIRIKGGAKTGEQKQTRYSVTAKKNCNFINIVRKKLHKPWKQFFFRCMSLTITFYEEEKKNNIKSHNFVSQLQTFFLNIFFFQSKEKGKGKVPHLPHPPSSP